MNRRKPVEDRDAAVRARSAGLVRQARRAGRVVIGVRQTKDAVREGRLAAALLAQELGELAGRAAVAALGITDRHIAEGLARLYAAGSGEEESGEEGEQSG